MTEKEFPRDLTMIYSEILDVPVTVVAGEVGAALDQGPVDVKLAAVAGDVKQDFDGAHQEDHQLVMV